MKKFIRKVAAVGAGSAMLLGTLGGALAASETLADLPEPFVVSGAYADVAFVVGDLAAGKDDAAQSVLTGYFGTTVEVAAGLGTQFDTQEVKLQDNVATSTGLDTVYDDTDSVIFDDGEVSIGGTSYDYHTELKINNTANRFDVETSLTSSDDKYEYDPKLEIKKDALRYCYVFDEAINISGAVGVSTTITSNNPWDMEFLGKTVRIDRVIDADSFVAQVGESWSGSPGDTYTGNGISMEVISCDTSDCIIDFGGDQRTVSEGNTVSKGEIDVYLQTAIAGVGSAAEARGTFIIGEDARLTINTGDKFSTGSGNYCAPSDGHGDPDCDKNNPDWVWSLAALTSSTSGATNEVCVENDFEAYNYNKDPAGIGEYYGFPDGYMYVGIDDLNVPDTDYMTVEFYTESGNTVDLSNAGDWPTSAIVLTMTSSEAEGLVLDIDGTGMTTALITDTKTDEVYLYMNTTLAGAGVNRTAVFYKDSNNLVQHAGNLTTSQAIGYWGYLNYKNTKSTDVSLGMYGNTSTDDSMYLGFVPLNSSDANDNLWFRLQDTDNAAGNYLGFGDTDDSESDEVIWGSTLAPTTTSAANSNVFAGGKKYDLLTGYGMRVAETDAAGDDDTYVVYVPGDQVKANVAIYEGSGAAASVVEPVLKTDSTASAYTKLILVGGPCVNTLTADFLGLTFPTCEAASGITENKAIVQLLEKDSKMALVVAGWEQADTKRAAEKVAAGGLTGTSIIVE
jgi:hypothetical protein